MLAPLKERALQESAAGTPSPPQAAEDGIRLREPEEEIRDLRRALRDSRVRLQRSALESTRRITALNQEVNRLSVLHTICRQQLARYESGEVIVELGRKLMQLSEKNEQLRSDAHRVWTLERTIEAAHAEYFRLSQERDELAEQLCLSKIEQFANVRS